MDPGGRLAHVMVLMGTRPEVVKLAPLIALLRSCDELAVSVLSTGQHKELIGAMTQVFGIEIDHDLAIASPGHTVNEIASRVLDRLGSRLRIERPDMVVVQGDTTSAMAGALAAFNEGVMVTHLEAGLRTGDLTAPFPEEANRKLISQVGSLHLAPTPWAKANLLAEGVDETSVVVTGNTVVDALLWANRQEAPGEDADLLARFASSEVSILVTLHRRESWGTTMAAIAGALRRVALENPAASMVVPMHPNPTVRQNLSVALGGLDNVLLTEPLGYVSFARALELCDVVVTDSGGVQEEAPTFGVPVLVLRRTTERPEGVAAGTSTLVGVDPDAVVRAIEEKISDRAKRGDVHVDNPFGDGLGARRSTEAIRWKLGARMDRPGEFRPIQAQRER